MVAELVGQVSPDTVRPLPLLHDALAPHARAAAITARLNRAHADLVDLTAELIAEEGWAEPGIRSVEHWLVVRAGLSSVAAREVAVVARRLHELPDLADRLHEGRLTIGQCAAVAAHVPATHQRVVVQVAEATTVPQLRRLLRRYSFDPATGESAAGGPAGDRDQAAAAREAEQAAEREQAIQKGQAPARLRMHQDPDGRFRMSFDAPADQGALVQNAHREAKDALFTSGEVEATYGDAMVEVASRSLGAVGSPHRASHYRVYVHLAADSPSGWVNGGGAIPPGLAALFACDGTLNPVIERDGAPVSVGRRMRIVPGRTRRLIEDRDGGCTYPGCPVDAVSGFLEIHHIEPWAEGGSTDLDTNVSLCPPHHRAVHTGDVVVSGDPGILPGSPGALTFRTRHGLPIGPPVLPEPSPPDEHPSDSGDAPDPWTRPWTPPTGEPWHAHWVDLPSDAHLDAEAERDLDAPWREDRPWRTGRTDEQIGDTDTDTDNDDEDLARSSGRPPPQPPGPIPIFG